LTVHDEFEVLAAVTMKNEIFWAVMPCSSETAGRFGGIYGFRVQDRRVNQARNWQEQEISWNRLLFDTVNGAICSSETSDSLRATRRYNSENHILRVYDEAWSFLFKKPGFCRRWICYIHFEKEIKHWSWQLKFVCQPLPPGWDLYNNVKSPNKETTRSVSPSWAQKQSLVYMKFQSMTLEFRLEQSF
jgi:hypothetical protein